MPKGEGYLRKRGNVWYFEFMYKWLRYYEKLIEVSPEHLKRIILFALNTSCRAGEILNLKWERVTWKRHILSQRPK